MKGRGAWSGVAFLAANASPARGAVVEYEFTLHVTDGPLAGHEYGGAFSYDDAATPIATNPPEYSPPAFDVLPLTSFAITIEGDEVGPSDFAPFNSPGVRVDEQGFRGLGGVESGEQGYGGILLQQSALAGGYEANLEEAAIEGHLPTYAVLGTVSYSLVPEPASLALGTAAVATLGLRRALRRFRRRPTSG